MLGNGVKEATRLRTGTGVNRCTSDQNSAADAKVYRGDWSGDKPVIPSNAQPATSPLTSIVLTAHQTLKSLKTTGNLD
jgi:hypothetical protein